MSRGVTAVDCEPLHILVIAAERSRAAWLLEALEEANTQPTALPHVCWRRVASFAEGFEAARSNPPDAILFDAETAATGSARSLKHLQAEMPHVPLFALTRTEGQAIAVQPYAEPPSSGKEGRVPLLLSCLNALFSLARRTRELQTLVELEHSLAQAQTEEAIGETLVEAVQRGVPSAWVAIALFVPQREGYTVRAYMAEAGWCIGTLSEAEAEQLMLTLCAREGQGSEAVPPAEGWVWRLLGTRAQAEEMSQVYALPAWGEEPSEQGRAHVDALLVLALPKGGSVGISAEEREFAAQCLGRAARALRNLRSQIASRQRLARMSTLSRISAEIVSSLEPDVVLRRVLGLTCEALDAVEGSILLKDKATGELVFALTRVAERDFLSGRRLAPGQGIAGWVAEHGKPVCVNDVRHDPRYYAGFVPVTGLEVYSLIAVPMVYRDEVMGVLEIVNKRSGRFSDEDVTLVEAVASFAAIALENAHLYSTTRSRAEELALLNAIGLALTATLDTQVVISQALPLVARLFHADHVSLLRLGPHSDAFRFTCALSEGRAMESPLSVPATEGIAGWVWMQGQPVRVPDVQRDPRFHPEVDQWDDFEAHALMAAPLRVRDRTIGVIEVISEHSDAFSSQQLDTLQALGATLAVALENAMLYEELRASLREREQAQAQMVHSEKMAALGRLVASITHEISNPLQAIQGCLALLGEEVEREKRPQELRKYLMIAREELQRISTIVARMRDFYRPTQQAMQLVDVHEVLESVLTLTGKQLQHSCVRVERDWSPDLPVIEANPDHLKQVFLNLILNAIDAMPDGGAVCVRTACDRLSAQRAGDVPAPAVRIEFSDTGSGIPPELLPRLFEPFQTTKEQGAGLGLFVSYSIIQAHHGQIRVSSQVGFGTTVTIWLPVHQPPLPAG